MDKPLDRPEINLITITCILVLVTAVLIGSVLTSYSFRRDCETMNAFRINDDVYTCLREYSYREYT